MIFWWQRNDLHRTLAPGTQDVKVTDKDGNVLLSICQTIFPASLTPIEARHIAAQLRDAADRAESTLK